MCEPYMEENRVVGSRSKDGGTKTGKDGMMERKIKGKQTLILYNLLA